MAFAQHGLPPISSEILSLHYNRVCRIAVECLDVAFNVCNNDMHHYTASKVFDVFDQTFLTAFVLNTGYWIYFVANQGFCLCVCARFGIPCRHIRNKSHWIDLQPIANPNGELIFFPKTHGPVLPVEYKIDVECINDPLGYSISINMNLIHSKMASQKFQLSMSASYAYAYQIYGPHHTIMFTPNPFFIEAYGTYMDELKKYKETLRNKSNSDLKKCHVVSVSDMPQSSLILLNVNAGRYVPATRISAALLSCWNPSIQIEKSYRDIETQTEPCDQVEIELNNYKKILEEAASKIWKYEEKQDFFPVYNNVLTNANLDIKAEAPVEYSIIIEESDEYDMQFPNVNFNRTIRKYNNVGILPCSLPDPIPSPSICNSVFNYDSYPSTPIREFCENPPVQTDSTETFSNQDYLPPPESKPKRKRGRPKIQRSEKPMTYSDVTKSRKSKVEKIFEPPPYPSTEESGEIFTGMPKYSDVVRSTMVNCSFSDPYYEVLNNVFKESSKNTKHMSDEDINNELALIDQFILEDAQKELENKNMR